MVTWVTPPEEVEDDPADVIVDKYFQNFGSFNISIRPLVNVDRVNIRRSIDKSNQYPNLNMATRVVNANHFQRWGLEQEKKTQSTYEDSIYVLKEKKAEMNLPLAQILRDLKPGSESLKLIEMEYKHLRDALKIELGKKFTDNEVVDQLKAIEFEEIENV